MKTYVGIGNDFTMAIPTPHSTSMGPQPCFESVVPLFWPPGMTVGANKMTHRVRHQGVAICQRGHDIGPMIGHVSSVPDPEDVVHTLGSSRKFTFGAGTVKVGGVPVAATGMLNLAPTPCLACADPVGIPQMGNFTMAVKNSVTCKITQMDMVLGAADMTSESLIDGVGSAVSEHTDPLTGWAAKTLASNVKSWAVNGYQTVTEGKPVNLVLDVKAPFGLDPYWSTQQGLVETKDGTMQLQIHYKLLGTEFGVDTDISIPPHFHRVGKENASTEHLLFGDTTVHTDDGTYEYEGSGDPLTNSHWGEVRRVPDPPEES